jgi:1-acyl-sn-glycerol-3-phosphate acyltransferase
MLADVWRPCRQFLVRHWVHLWARFVLLLGGFYRVRVCGWDNHRAAEQCRCVHSTHRCFQHADCHVLLPDGLSFAVPWHFRAILVFNHPSYVDAAVIAALFQPSGVSKAGVATIPFVGLFAVALQLFFVERRGSSDLSNRHVLHGDAVTAIAQRAADRRCASLATLRITVQAQGTPLTRCQLSLSDVMGSTPSSSWAAAVLVGCIPPHSPTLAMCPQVPTAGPGA